MSLAGSGQFELAARVTGREHPRLQALLVALSVPAVATVLYFCDPAGAPVWAQCPFHLISGLHCPGCGSIRALHALVHGEVAAALGFNALAMTALPFLAWPWLSNVSLALRGRRLPEPVLPRWVGWGVLAVVLAFWVLRNIPAWPLTLLAPQGMT